MNNSSSGKVCKIKKFLCDLGKVQLKSDYNLNLSLYRDTDCEKPSYTKSVNGSSKCEIMKILAVLSAVLLIASAISELCSCNCKRK